MDMKYLLVDFGLPVCICVILPVLIVLIVNLGLMNRENKRAQVLIKAIEANNTIDADKLAEAMKKPQKTARELLNLRLLRGCIFFFVGVALCIFGVVLDWTGGFHPSLIASDVTLGVASLAIGISYLIVYFVSRKQVINQEDI